MSQQNNVNNSLAHTKWNGKYHVVLHQNTGEKFIMEKKGSKKGHNKNNQWKGVEIIEGEVCPVLYTKKRHQNLVSPEKNRISLFSYFNRIF